MLTIDWPTTLKAAQFSWALKKSTQQFRGLFNGGLQATDLMAERWVVSCTLPPVTRDNGPAIEALADVLAGGVNRVRLYHQGAGGRAGAGGYPRGTMRGGKVKVQTARGDSTIQIEDATAAPNLVHNASFEHDANVDGLADSWSVVVGSSGDGARAHFLLLSTSNVVHGAYSQHVEITAAGNSFDSVLYQRVAISPSTPYTLAWNLITNVGSKVFMLVRQYKANLTTTGADASSGFWSALTPERKSLTFITQADAAFVDIMVRGINTVGEYLRCDAAQLEVGAVATAFAGAPTLLSGDMFKIGAQVFRAYGDYTIAPSATVTVANRVRVSASVGAAVVTDKPTILAVLPSMILPGNYAPRSFAPPLFDLEETWD